MAIKGIELVLLKLFSGREYRAMIGKEEITTQKTKDAAMVAAVDRLENLVRYATAATEVRVCGDGTIITVRQTAPNQAVAEYHRQDRCGSSCGTMSNGMIEFATVEAYADYLLSQHD